MLDLYFYETYGLERAIRAARLPRGRQIIIDPRNAIGAVRRNISRGTSGHSVSEILRTGEVCAELPTVRTADVGGTRGGNG